MLTHKLPDGPQSHEWIQTLQWLNEPLQFMETCAEQYGDLFTVQIGPLFTPQVLVSNPQALQQIFSADGKQLESGAAAGVTSPLLGNSSMITLAGKPHRRQRKLLTPPFHGERMRTYGELIAEITEQVTAEWQAGETTILPSMQAISLRVILKAVFGLDDGPRYQRLQERLLKILNPQNAILSALGFLFPILQIDLGPWSPWGGFLELLRQLDEEIYAEIRDRRQHPDPSRTDILSLMMAARDEAGNPMTDEELRDELITLLAAGHETTAVSLTWAFYWIHHLPQVREKLLQELETAGELAPTEILKLPYLDAVCAETLRLYPVGMLALHRAVTSPLEVGDYLFAPGTLVVPCIYLTHHREDLYPQPKQFKPERFLERQFAPYEYLPFGGGNRRCIGLAFALFEMKIVLAHCLTRWQMELLPQRVQPVRKGALLQPSGGVRMAVHRSRVLTPLK